MRQHFFCTWVLWFLLACSGCQGQSRQAAPAGASALVGGGCDGCALMYLGMPSVIPSVSISPGWDEPGQKLVVTGTVFQLDGRAPARDVILYYWQTDASGLYSPREGMHPEARKHGHIRGWVKTDAAGQYTIRTIRPAPYPNEEMPAHIHIAVKEPGLPNEYYIDEINFEDDKLLVASLKRYPPEKRGGTGIVRTVVQDGVQLARRDIVLGLNIPNYPK